MTAARILPRSFYRSGPVELGPLLLNKVLTHCRVAGRIVEVEAYDSDADPASHAYRGPTSRNRTMFGPAGRLYVYRSYGLHWCANVTCGPADRAGAVLIRALAPLRGVGAMTERRGRRRPRDLASGPGKLTEALGIGGEHDGVDLTRGPVRLVDDGTPPPDDPAVTTRVGISVATDRPWRWFVRGDVNVSAGRGVEVLA